MAKRTPNFLVIQADQMSAQSMPFHGNMVVKAPVMARLAEEGAVFDSFYCNFPLCAPSRFSMLSGQLASRIGAYDNGAEFAASIPTIAHYLRNLGYLTCLSGKMHFVGPDQLHGFEERLTTDIYPADFSWTADWRPRNAPATREMGVVQKAGACRRSVQIDFDDDVAFQAERFLYDAARSPSARPFFLVASFTHPHDPFSISEPYWNRYRHDEIDMPKLPRAKDPQSERIRRHFGIDEANITEEQVRNARHAYYGSISYLDDKVAGLLDALRDCKLLDSTIVVLTSDHGEFLGERDLWFKRSFFEQSIRVPFVISWRGSIRPSRIRRNASLVDLLPTLYEFAAGDRLASPAANIDGSSLVPTLNGEDPGTPDLVLGEILCETTSRPEFMVRRGNFKYIACDTDPTQLFDLSADPDELRNLSGLDDYRKPEQQLAAIVRERWNVNALANDVVKSQERRRFVSGVLGKGNPFSWDFQPDAKASTKYYRARASADVGVLLQRAISAGIVTIEGGTYLHEGRVLGRDAAAVEAFLRSEPETANAVERQVTEAVGFL